MTVALLPNGTALRALAAVPGISPGLLSAGLGDVSREQTYLDITQGSRVFDSLYDPQELAPTETLGNEVGGWESDRRASRFRAGRDRPRPARLHARGGEDGGGH